MLPDMPESGNLTQSFLSWEEAVVEGFKNGAHKNPVWAGWRSARGVCVTRKEHRLPYFDAARQSFQAAGLEIATRRSGGTVVAQGAGILNITSIAVHQGSKNIGASYLAFCSALQTRLKTAGFETEIGPVSGSYCDGDYNLILDGKKLAGTSQRWARGPKKDAGYASIVLNHAVILLTEAGVSGCRRVNDFHEVADKTRPYDENTSISLWESKQNKTGLDKHVFFDKLRLQLCR